MKDKEKGKWYPKITNFNAKEQEKSVTMKKDDDKSLQKRIRIDLYK